MQVSALPGAGVVQTETFEMQWRGLGGELQQQQWQRRQTDLHLSSRGGTRTNDEHRRSLHVEVPLIRVSLRSSPAWLPLRPVYTTLSCTSAGIVPGTLILRMWKMVVYLRNK